MIQHRHGRVVGVHDRAAQHARREIAIQGHQQRGAVRDPVAQGLAGEIDVVPRENVHLAVQRQVIRILRRDHLGQEARARPALVDGLRRHRARDHVALARRARILEPHVLDDEQRGRLVVKLLARLLADLHEVGSTRPARALRVRQRVLDTLPRQQGWQRRPAVPSPRARRLRGRGRRRRGRGVQRLRPAREFQQQLGGVELLGAAPIQITAEEFELVAELRDDVLLVVHLGEELEAVLAEIVRVVRQRLDGARHSLS